MGDAADAADGIGASAKRSGFRLLWGATGAANLADGLFKLALPLYAARLTSSPGLVAGVLFAITLPWLVFSLPAGVLADRLDRRRAVAGSNLLRAVALGVFLAAAALGSVGLPVLYVIALLLGCAETLADTASASLLPSLVARSELEGANARLVGTQTVTNEFAGPALGGALAAVGLALALGASSGLYLAAGLLLLFVRGSFRAPGSRGDEGWRSEVREGLVFVWRHRLLRALSIIVAGMNLCWSAWLSVMVLYVVDPGPGGLSESGYGILVAGIGAGGLLGAVIVAPAHRAWGARWVIGADLLGTFAMVAVPAVTANPWAVGAAAFAGGVGSTMWSVTVASIRQRVVPDALLGRVGGALRLFGYGALSLGAVLAGVVAELAGVRAVFLCCAVLSALLVVPFLAYVTGEALDAAEDRGLRG